MCIEISWKQPVFTAFGMPTLFLADSRSIEVAWGPEKVFQ